MEFPEDCLYSEEHEWVRKDGDEVIIGITDYAQQALGDIVFVELPSEGDALKQMEPFGSVEAVKAVADLYSPVAGTVTKVNEALQENPALVNSSPYGDGWMIRAKVSEETDWDRLMDAAAYRKLVEEKEAQGEGS
jgi:glycine cleavage system H protein